MGQYQTMGESGVVVTEKSKGNCNSCSTECVVGTIGMAWVGVIMVPWTLHTLWRVERMSDQSFSVPSEKD